MKWNHPQTLRASFLAVSTATIATKYSFCCIFRDLQDLHSFATLRYQNFSKFLPEWKWNFVFSFSFFDEICDFSAKIWWNFAGIFLKKKILPEFHRNCQEMTNCLDIVRKSARKIRKMAQNARKFRNQILWEIFIFHFIFSFVSLWIFTVDTPSHSTHSTR
jgi:hypothetical protein